MASRALTGDFAKLNQLAAKLAGAPKVLEAAARNMADEALSLVAQGFDAEQDPDGVPWKPLKKRIGKILQDTGRLKASWHRISVNQTGFKIAAGAEYAKYHQHGTRRMVARKQVPDSGGRLPRKWEQAMTEAAQEAFELLRGQG